MIDAHGRCHRRPRRSPLLPDRVRIDRAPPPPTERPRIREPLATGVHAIDALLTCGRGQRLGIFSGSGVGKSVLLGMMSRYTNADVIVTGLIGERGREVNDFLERDLGPARHGAQRGRRGDQQRAGADARAGRFDRDGRRRVFPRLKANKCCC